MAMVTAIADDSFPRHHVSTIWLRDHLADPQLVVIDCRFALMQPNLGREQYEAAHIPGAFYLDLNQDLAGPVQAQGGRHPLPDVALLVNTLQAMGMTSDPDRPTWVVVYDDSRLGFAARLWWLLRYLGHDQVAVLDGGWSAWQAACHAVTAAVPLAKTGRFVPRLRPDWVVDIAQVRQALGLPGVVLVDSREGDRYRGEREPIDPVAGHIPGAVNYPWQEVTDVQGFLRSPDFQRQRWVALDPDIPDIQDVIVYCGSGVTACVNLLALELAGLPPGKLYAGSWSDWCAYLPLAAGSDAVSE
jgi:thiosulfate/3-mercaptopyruvate sulfurtransferase